jgi:putative endonuclease
VEFHVYILYSEKCDKYYVGHTHSMDKRLFEHNHGKGGKFSVICAPWKLVYSELFGTRSEAMKREKEIKNRKSRKYIETLISFGNESGI